ncbi:hypothetical protein GGR56DRAFT_669632 [Xylariaceae sp. FL0804]|nr:hypothetical protein GGR56DRAFT_669632 [Xylariaceae sp. FL0804]
MVPDLVEEGLIFRDRLLKAAENEKLERPKTIRTLAFEVAEHNAVLGPAGPGHCRPDAAQPDALLGCLPAVLRETLRLFPPLRGTVRQTHPGRSLTHTEMDKQYPTHGFIRYR